MNEKIIFLDLDGVCCDFVGQVLTLQHRTEREYLDHLEANPDVHPYDALESLVGLSRSHFWDWIGSHGVGFWSNMPKFAWFDFMFAELSKHGQVLFLTSAPSKEAFYGKALWIEQHLGHKYIKDLIVCFADHKHLMAQPNRILIDDTDKNIVKWLKTGHHCWHFPSLQFFKRHPASKDIEQMITFVKEHKHGH